MSHAKTNIQNEKSALGETLTHRLRYGAYGRYKYVTHTDMDNMMLFFYTALRCGYRMYRSQQSVPGHRQNRNPLIE